MFTPAQPLKAIVLPALALMPPMTLPVAPFHMATPENQLPSAFVPVMSVPIRLGLNQIAAGAGVFEENAIAVVAGNEVARTRYDSADEIACCAAPDANATVRIAGSRGALWPVLSGPM